MTFYLSGAGVYCAFLLLSKFSDKECSKTDLTSWLVLAIASSLWIVVVPISLIEISNKLKQKDRFNPFRQTSPIAKQQYIETVVQGEFDSNAISQLNAGNS